MHYPKTIRIGTRDSRLALWQANFVAQKLNDAGISTILVPVKSEGDQNTKTPLYQMGIQGIFTRTLDEALLNNKIDLAVHSYKDVPTDLPAELVLAAIPERGNFRDILVSTNPIDEEDWAAHHKTIATGSIRRIHQWLRKYPHHRIENLRGNIDTRLQKLEKNGYDGILLSSIALERLGISGYYTRELDFLPAAAQGALAIVTRASDTTLTDMIFNYLNHKETAFCTYLEKLFLKKLTGNCSLPISCLAIKSESQVTFKGELFIPPDFKEHIGFEFTASADMDAIMKVQQKSEMLLNEVNKFKTLR